MKLKKIAKGLKRIICIVLASVCIFINFTFLESKNTVAKTSLGEIDAEIRSLDEQLKNAAKTRKSAEAAYNDVKDDYENIKKRKTAIDEEIESIYNESEILKALVIGYLNQKIALDERICKTQKELDEHMEILRQRLRLNYECGDSNYFILLFSSKGLYDFLTSADRLSDLIEKDTELIKECENICKKLQAEKDALANITKEAENKSVELKSTLIDLQERQNEALQMMKTLEKDKEASKKAYLEAKKEEDAFQSKLKERLEERAELNSNQYSGEDFIWPLPSKYKWISSPFGNRIHPVLGTPQFHRGIDIPAPKSTEIYCVAKGTVIETGKHYANGKYVIVDHGGGISTMYAHQNKILVKEGDILEQGEIIGLVGMTGYATGYHLHLSVYKNGKPVNPVNYY